MPIPEEDTAFQTEGVDEQSSSETKTAVDDTEISSDDKRSTSSGCDEDSVEAQDKNEQNLQSW